MIEKIPLLKRFTAKPLEAKSFSVHPMKEAQSVVTTERQWTDKQPHPGNMDKYDDLCNDPETSIALDLLADMIAGVGFHTEMSEDIDEDHPNKKVIDDWAERVNADEKFKEISKTTLGKGFCPVEILPDYHLKTLPPEGFYIWRDKYGRVYRYTQEVGNTEVARWQISGWQEQLVTEETDLTEAYSREGYQQLVTEAQKTAESLRKIVLFVNDEDTSHPYGKSLVDPIADLIEERRKINKDMPAAIHRFAYPIGVIRSRQSGDKIRDAFQDKGSDDWVSIGNAEKDEVDWGVIEASARQDWIPYIEFIYYQIAQALHAPLVLTLKNATEASATKILEAVDRFVDGRQRYIKRRIERYFWQPQCGEPVPRLVWGQPTTGVEDVTFTEIASIINSPKVAYNQAQYILTQYFPDLPEPEKQPEPVLPFQQPPKPTPQLPIQQYTEKLNDLSQALEIIETNHKEHKLSLTDAVRHADRTITVFCKRMYGSEAEAHRQEEYDKFMRRLLKIEKLKTYHVSVED